jgi:hypothetical protein
MWWALLACTGTGGEACDRLAAVSVTVTVEGPEAPDVYWVHEGTAADCDPLGDGTWACGYEVAGEIVVRAEAAGWQTADEAVTVEAGECHVVGEQVTLAMEPEVVCSGEEVPSVVVSVVGASGEALTGVAVEYRREDTDGNPTDCVNQGENSWVCGWEVPGAITVVAVADGHAEASDTVTVEADECHVSTVYTILALEELPG